MKPREYKIQKGTFSNSADLRSKSVLTELLPVESPLLPTRLFVQLAFYRCCLCHKVAENGVLANVMSINGTCSVTDKAEMLLLRITHFIAKYPRQNHSKERESEQ